MGFAVAGGALGDGDGVVAHRLHDFDDVGSKGVAEEVMRKADRILGIARIVDARFDILQGFGNKIGQLEQG